jgi:hypothetical protein
MGTRCLTFVYDGVYVEGEKPILNMYRQMDGYPTCHGAELAEFLNSFKAITNGISSADRGRKTANGMGCLAAQLIGEFKQEVGGIYIYPIDSNDCWQEYEYHIWEDKVEVRNPRDVIFSGNWKSFERFCSSDFEELEPLSPLDTQSGKDWLKSVLRGGEVTVTFLKSDGTERVMNCTLSHDIIPQTPEVVAEGSKPKVKRQPSDDVLPVWDIDANGWRSFRWDSIKRIEAQIG